MVNKPKRFHYHILKFTHVNRKMCPLAAKGRSGEETKRICSKHSIVFYQAVGSELLQFES